MIFLDTHVVVWLYAGLTGKFAPSIQTLMNENELFISPIVRLELQYLHEIGRVTVAADEIAVDLFQRIGLTVSERRYNAIVGRALGQSWTRDPFDRLIVANAALDEAPLITKDEMILSHYPLARWAST